MKLILSLILAFCGANAQTSMDDIFYCFNNIGDDCLDFCYNQVTQVPKWALDRMREQCIQPLNDQMISSSSLFKECMQGQGYDRCGPITQDRIDARKNCDNQLESSYRDNKQAQNAAFSCGVQLIDEMASEMSACDSAGNLDESSNKDSLLTTLENRYRHKPIFASLGGTLAYFVNFCCTNENIFENFSPALMQECS